MTSGTQANKPERSRRVADAVKQYLALVWSVIPVPEGSKATKRPWGEWATKQPGRAEWRAWWREEPCCNLAVVYAGSAAPDGKQLVCVDTDTDAAEAWVRAQRPLPPTATVKTSKGYHRYFYAPADREHFGGTETLPEVRAGAHYSMLPPSIHPDGGEYAWCEALAPDEAGIADLPQWGIDLMPVAEENPVEKSPAQPIEDVPEGRRNDTLFKQCARWRAADVPENELRAAAKTWNAEHCKPPLDAREVETCVRSALRYAPGTSVRVQEAVRAREYAADQLAKAAPEAEPERAIAASEPLDPADAASLVASVEQAVNRVAVTHHRIEEGTPPALLADIAGEMIEDFEQERLSKRCIRGLRTGFEDLDWHFGGFWRQRLMVVQGPSGYGKTTWADHCVFATAKAILAEQTGEIVAVFLLEDTKRRIIDSWMGYAHAVPRSARRAGSEDYMTPAIEERLAQGYFEFPRLPIAVTDDMRDIGAIEAHVRRLSEQHPLAGVVVDHAQEVEVPRGRSRHEELSQVALRLRDLADKLEVPVMLLSQTTQKDGEYHPEYSKDLRQKASLCFIVTRGEVGMTRQEAVLSNKTTVFCDKSRYCPPSNPLTLVGDWDTGRLYTEDEANRRDLDRYHENRRRRDE
jgi:hypothetical protein